MLLAIGSFFAILGAFICTQNTRSKLGPALAILGLVIGIKGL
jgi:hypothetical protein